MLPVSHLGDFHLFPVLRVQQEVRKKALQSEEKFLVVIRSGVPTCRFSPGSHYNPHVNHTECDSLQCDLSLFILIGIKSQCIALKKCRHIFRSCTATVLHGCFVQCNLARENCTAFGVSLTLYRHPQPAGFFPILYMLFLHAFDASAFLYFK